MNEMVSATGWLITEVDCPICDEVIQLEGDAKGEVMECPYCSVKIMVD